MEKIPFKQYTISRSKVAYKDDYKDYREDLHKDFNGRCGYCDMPQDLITTNFHIDHFIPQRVFTGIKDYLKTEYNNLIYACPKCNLSKGGKYEGDLENDVGIVNKLFYNPVDVDYNTIFYRDKWGGIHSDDEKGQNMINYLKLYRPVHQEAWLLENLERLCDELIKQLSTESDSIKKDLLQKAYNIVSTEQRKLGKSFRSTFRGDKFQAKS